MRSPSDDFLQVAPQVLGPLVVKASLYLDFERIAELLGHDLHAGATGVRSARTPREW